MPLLAQLDAPSRAVLGDPQVLHEPHPSLLQPLDDEEVVLGPLIPPLSPAPLFQPLRDLQLPLLHDRVEDRQGPAAGWEDAAEPRDPPGHRAELPERCHPLLSPAVQGLDQQRHELLGQREVHRGPDALYRRLEVEAHAGPSDEGASLTLPEADLETKGRQRVEGEGQRAVPLLEGARQQPERVVEVLTARRRQSHALSSAQFAGTAAPLAKESANLTLSLAKCSPLARSSACTMRCQHPG